MTFQPIRLRAQKQHEQKIQLKHVQLDFFHNCL